ncbi:MAG: DUF1643 domain-containing protein [Kurthia gibsonii]
MKVVKSAIKIEVVYDDSFANKYIVRKEWDKNKKAALVIMKNAGDANEIVQDQTTMYVNNNLLKLDYGSASIMNLFPSIENKNRHTSTVENLKFVQIEKLFVDIYSINKYPYLTEMNRASLFTDL